jgi:cation diffusion facilitator CzcD-associated flavoprotein CzcO
MRPRTLEADYLVVGSGAAGMAFADSLISECDAEITMVDRRPAPGGHWNDAYPFVTGLQRLAAIVAQAAA